LLFSGKFTQSTFSSLRGVPLTNLQLTLTHQDNPPPGLGDPPLEQDTIHIATTLKASVSVFALSATWGITNNVDIGFAVPIVNLFVSGTSIGTIVPVTGVIAHYWGGTATDPQLVDTASGRASHTGLGDVSIRAKFNLVQSPTAGAAFLADVRLPTGKPDELVGTGKTSVTSEFITSLTFKECMTHVTISYLSPPAQNQNTSVLPVPSFDAHTLTPC